VFHSNRGKKYLKTKVNKTMYAEGGVTGLWQYPKNGLDGLESAPMLGLWRETPPRGGSTGRLRVTRA
jgi:hypothetical protein